MTSDANNPQRKFLTAASLELKKTLCEKVRDAARKRIVRDGRQDRRSRSRNRAALGRGPDLRRPAGRTVGVAARPRLHLEILSERCVEGHHAERGPEPHHGRGSGGARRSPHALQAIMTSEGLTPQRPSLVDVQAAARRFLQEALPEARRVDVIRVRPAASRRRLGSRGRRLAAQRRDPGPGPVHAACRARSRTSTSSGWTAGSTWSLTKPAKRRGRHERELFVLWSFARLARRLRQLRGQVRCFICGSLLGLHSEEGQVKAVSLPHCPPETVAAVQEIAPRMRWRSRAEFTGGGSPCQRRWPPARLGFIFTGSRRRTPRPCPAGGVAGAAVETLVEGRLAAVVSRIAPGRIRPQRANLAAHHRVLHELAEQAPVLPVVFGTVAGDEEQLRCLLQENHDALVQRLSACGARWRWA